MSAENKPDPRPSFRCLDLRSNPPDPVPLVTFLQGPKKPECSKGLHAFYTHTSVVSNFLTRAGDPPLQLLRSLFESASFEVERVPNVEPWNPQAGKVFWLGEGSAEGYPERVLNLLGILREAQAKNLFSSRPGFALNPPIVFGLQSRDPSRSSRLVDWHEYLLWDDGGVWDKDAWNRKRASYEKIGLGNGKATDRLAWLGSGWMRWRLEDALRPSDPPSGERWPDSPKIAEWAEGALQALAQQDQLLVDYFRKQDTEPAGWESWNNYVRTLCDFLPYHRPRGYRSGDPDDWYPSNQWADEGGPIPWRGMLDPRLHLHRRHLLLDGWLTLWPYEDDLYLQPGSLALLYWAARWGDMPHTESPEAFYQGYKWDSPYWFGGRWGKTR